MVARLEAHDLYRVKTSTYRNLSKLAATDRTLCDILRKNLCLVGFLMDPRLNPLWPRPYTHAHRILHSSRHWRLIYETVRKAQRRIGPPL